MYKHIDENAVGGRVTRSALVGMIAAHAEREFFAEWENDATPEGSFSYDGCDVEIAEIRRRMEAGDLAAWFQAEIRLTVGDLSASDFLGGCSYASLEEFQQGGGYYQDMINGAAEQIADEIAEMEPEDLLAALSDLYFFANNSGSIRLLSPTHDGRILIVHRSGAALLVADDGIELISKRGIADLLIYGEQQSGQASAVYPAAWKGQRIGLISYEIDGDRIIAEFAPIAEQSPTEQQIATVSLSPDVINVVAYNGAERIGFGRYTPTDPALGSSDLLRLII